MPAPATAGALWRLWVIFRMPLCLRSQSGARLEVAFEIEIPSASTAMDVRRTQIAGSLERRGSSTVVEILRQLQASKKEVPQGTASQIVGLLWTVTCESHTQPVGYASLFLQAMGLVSMALGPLELS